MPYTSYRILLRITYTIRHNPHVHAAFLSGKFDPGGGERPQGGWAAFSARAGVTPAHIGASARFLVHNCSRYTRTVIDITYVILWGCRVFFYTGKKKLNYYLRKKLFILLMKKKKNEGVCAQHVKRTPYILILNHLTTIKVVKEKK